jgi:hypothetical protein
MHGPSDGVARDSRFAYLESQHIFQAAPERADREGNERRLSCAGRGSSEGCEKFLESGVHNQGGRNHLLRSRQTSITLIHYIQWLKFQRRGLSGCAICYRSLAERWLLEESEPQLAGDPECGCDLFFEADLQDPTCQDPACSGPHPAQAWDGDVPTSRTPDATTGWRSGERLGRCFQFSIRLLGATSPTTERLLRSNEGEDLVLRIDSKHTGSGSDGNTLESA